MGNACQICREGDGNSTHNPYQRKFTNHTGPSSSAYTLSVNDNLYHQGDAPNPALVTPNVTLPELTPLIKEILSRQNSIRQFAGENISGVKLPPFQLKNKGMCYDGEWKSGLPHGFGKAYYHNGGYFQGFFRNGVADCSDGIFVYPDGTFYRGKIKDSSASGFGVLVYKNGEMVYTGEWLNDKPHGMGKEEYKDGSTYTGCFIAGTKQGNGTFRWPDGGEYTGHFNEGFMHGEGTQKLANGEVYRGTFFRNMRQGEGDLELALGTYNGQFTQNKKAGQGEFTFKDGRVFRGGFFDNLPEGFGEMKMPNGQVIRGIWKGGVNVKVQNSPDGRDPNYTPVTRPVINTPTPITSIPFAPMVTSMVRNN